MGIETFNASAAYHLTTVSTDQNVTIIERIGGIEKERIKASDEPEIARLEHLHECLGAERAVLRARVGAAWRHAAHTAWPMWRTIMAVVFWLSGFALILATFEPFDFSPILTWLASLGLACVCAYGTAEVLERTNTKALVHGLSIVLFVVGLAGLAALASVRGDIFVHHLQNLASSGDGSSGTPDAGLAFYTTVAPKMRMFLTLLSLGLELAAGLALHAIHDALKARSLPPTPESHRLEVVEAEIGEIEAQLKLLQNKPEVFELEFRRNLYIGLLAAAARHTRSLAKLPMIILAALGLAGIMRGQPIDLLDALDFTATSSVKGFDGRTAAAENIESAARIIASLPPGSRVTVAGISDESFSRPMILLQGVIPTDSGKLREYDEIAGARNRLAASLRRRAGSIAPLFRETDIIGFLMFAGMAIESTPRMKHVLVIHSDMRQSAAPLDIEHVPVVPVRETIQGLEDRHLIPDLSGVEVFIYGAHAIGKDIAYWLSLREFWTEYFRRSHAIVGAFSMMREVPDLASR